jgi:hypothetical protein
MFEPNGTNLTRAQQTFTKLPSVATTAAPYIESFLFHLEKGLVLRDDKGDYRNWRHPYVFARDNPDGGLLIYQNSQDGNHLLIGTAQ